jgi:nucleoside-diphosphate-sugar epimerase
MNLVILGFGYTSQHFEEDHALAFAQVTATVRDPARASELTRNDLTVLPFSSAPVGQRLREALLDADRLLISVPPGAEGDPALLALGDIIKAAPRLTHLVYLSTVGVYGDHGGAWSDEETPCLPSNDRSQWRLAAEEGWLGLGRESGRHVHVLRLSGIYGPGNNALVNLQRGTARRIIKPGQVFNRIHVADIGSAIMAGFSHTGCRVWNITDDEPAPPQDVVVYGARLLGIKPPPEIAFDTANMSPMARSFYAECKRVKNVAAKAGLGWHPLYPT